MAIENEFAGKVALVTGANRGIGEATARLFASHGVHVLLHHRARGQRMAQAVYDSIVAQGGKVTLICADLALSEEIERMFEDISKEIERLDILVNNAAMSSWAGVAELDGQKLSYSWQVMFGAPALCISRSLPLMKAGGRIVNITTVVTEVPIPGATPYRAPKLALKALTEQDWALELKPKGILINAVSPGFVKTRALNMVSRMRMFAAWADWMKVQFPGVDLVMEPQEVAETIFHLCSQQYVETGTTVEVDRGIGEFCRSNRGRVEEALRTL